MSKILMAESDKNENEKIQNRLKKQMNENTAEKINKYIEIYKNTNPTCNADDPIIELANKCGVSVETVKRWKQKKGRVPEQWNLIALTNTIGCSIDELFKGVSLTMKDKEDLKTLGFSEEAAIELIKNCSEEKMQERIDESIYEKMRLQEQTSNKISASDNQPEIPTLFEHSSAFPKIKYSNLLNTLINENLINKLIINLDDYRKQINGYINDAYPKLNREQKIAKLKKDIELDKARKFTMEQGKPKEHSRDIETAEQLYENLINFLSGESAKSTELAKLTELAKSTELTESTKLKIREKTTANLKKFNNFDEKFQKEVLKIFHKLLIDMLFPLQ